MDFDRNNNYQMSFRRSKFGSVTGTIVDMMPTRVGNRRAEGCTIFVTIEDMDGNTVNFLMSPATYVVDAPMPLIYPPQYNAVVAAVNRNGQMINVDYYNTALVNQEQTLQLNMDASVDVRTTNNQYFQGNPANHNLVVIYDNSTRSIPAQTTPIKVVVLCPMQY